MYCAREQVERVERFPSDRIAQISTFYKMVAMVYKNSGLQGGSNMTGTDLCVNKPSCAAAVRP